MESHQPRQTNICVQGYQCPQCTQNANCLLGQERELVRRIQAGDEVALIEFLMIQEGNIRNQLKKNGVIQQNINAVVSDVMTVILDKIKDFEWRGVSPTHWVSTITRRKRLEHFKYLEKDLIENSFSLDNLSFTHEGSHPIDHSETTTLSKVERDQKVHEAVGKLSKAQKQIIILIYFEGIENSRTIANILKMNSETVRVYHKRALKKLSFLLSTHQ